MKQVLFLLFFTVWAIAVAAQSSSGALPDSVEVIEEVATEGVVSPPVEAYDEEEDIPEPLFFPADSMDKIRRQKDYGYMKNLDSMLRNLQMEAPEPPKAEQPSRGFFDIGLVKLLIWGVALFAVLYILYQLLAGQQNLFYRNKKLEPETESAGEKKEGTAPLLLSQQAAARGDYRLAIRYHYLYILQLMGEKQLILLQPQKSDDRYRQEVKGKPLSPDFSRVTLQYEYVWYGEFQVNRQQFETIMGGYRKFIETWL